MKKTHQGRKRFIISIMVTMLVVFMTYPLYMNKNGAKALIESRHSNKIFRVDVFNSGNKNHNHIKLLSQTTYTKSNFCKSDKGQCVSVSEKISSAWRKYVVKFQVIGDGEVTISLLGPEKKLKNQKYPILIDYKNFNVNGQYIFTKIFSLWHNKPYKYHIKAKDGDIVELSFQARKHHIRFRDLRKICNVDWLVFLSILIISFLMSYKFVHYVSKFKIVDNNSRIDIVFVLVFVSMLFVPMSHISNADKSMQENRMLAKFPQLKVATRGALGKQFEQWFNDRFLSRNLMIDIYSLINREINRIYHNGGAIWIKSNNWMFKNSVINFAIPKKEQTAEIIEQINLLNNFCKNNNIKMYILVVPSKESIYQEFFSRKYQQAKQCNDLNNYLLHLIPSFDSPTVFPQKELKEASKKDFVFFKQTHHWTEWGAYNGYQALISVIKKDFPNTHISNLDEYNVLTSKLLREDWDRKFGFGQTTRMLRIKDKYALKNLLKDNYTYYNHKNEIKPVITDKDLYRIKYFQNKQLSGAPKVFLTGTSMNENMLQFLPYSFSEVKYYRLNNVKNVPNAETFKLLKRYKKDILQFKPDILILNITSWNIPNLTNLTKD